MTATSGRGIGLDAVRATVEQLNGRVRLASARGQGTTLSIEVPVSLATARALIVRRAGRRFGIPLMAASRIIEVAKADIESVGVNRTVVEGGERLRLTDLADAYQLNTTVPERLAVIVELGDTRASASVLMRSIKRPS